MPHVTVGEENSCRSSCTTRTTDRAAGGADPRLSTRRPLVGETGAGAARSRETCDHVRPSRVWAVQPSGDRLRLRHLRRRSQDTGRQARPARGRPGRLLDGDGRGHPVPGNVRLRARGQGCALRPHPSVLLQTDDNPKGVPQSVFDGFMETIKQDRYAWFKFFFDNFYNFDKLHGTRISDEAWNASFEVAAGRPLTPPSHACQPGSRTSAPTCRRSTCPFSSFRALRIASCHRRHRPAPPRPGERHPVHRDRGWTTQHWLDARR